MEACKLCLEQMRDFLDLIFFTFFLSPEKLPIAEFFFLSLRAVKTLIECVIQFDNSHVENET